jgi:hypothetical protein
MIKFHINKKWITRKILLTKKYHVLTWKRGQVAYYVKAIYKNQILYWLIGLINYFLHHKKKLYMYNVVIIGNIGERKDEDMHVYYMRKHEYALSNMYFDRA